MEKETYVQEANLATLKNKVRDGGDDVVVSCEITLGKEARPC